MKIKSEDFRIGNIVEQGVIFTISCIGGVMGCHVDSSSGTFYPMAKLRPIRISPMWMIRLGAKDCKVSYTLRTLDLKIKGKYIIFYNHKEKIIGFHNTEDPQDVRIMDYYRIKYVHQLQNLYYALVGKELIKI